eukprot:CAMPEP_0172495870 /NCGR_PEP_ID=MMETSP1066-20121228/79286_1 /TAXON_ID=671091 /ORGANISM="Coscinodiscus wailesii, Strain CCMP2513" /LENGTH=274 /DNA_ID=CAMNT_0013267853 /DNA_START=70 /DNA_END=891 /DNA_ORIENTATION=+
MTSSNTIISYIILAILLPYESCGLSSRLSPFRRAPSLFPASRTDSVSLTYPSQIQLRKSNVCRVSSTEDISSINDTDTNDDVHVLGQKTIRRLEKEMEKQDRVRQQLLNKLTKAENVLETLQQKKTEYLEGMQIGRLPQGQNFSETTVRSAVKAMMWRVIAGSVTFVTALRFSGSISQALSIVGSDFFSKSFTMFVGERLMNKSKAGRKSGADGVGRSLAKALIWRLFAICNTLTMAFFIAKDLSIASKIAGSDAIVKTALMFVYERVWAKVEW